MNRSMPGLPVHHQLPEFTQTHAHQVTDDIQPSHPLWSPSPPALNPSQHQGLFQWVNTWGGESIGVSASASILPMNTQDWSPSGWTGWISLLSKGLSRVLSNTIVQKHWFSKAHSYSRDIVCYCPNWKSRMFSISSPWWPVNANLCHFPHPEILSKQFSVLVSQGLLLRSVFERRGNMVPIVRYTWFSRSWSVSDASPPPQHTQSSSIFNCCWREELFQSIFACHCTKWNPKFQ